MSLLGFPLLRYIDVNDSEEVTRAKLLTSGTWTHDYPITFDRARELGLPVRGDMPENVLHLMQLYPQPTSRQPSVEYLPVRNPPRVALVRKREIEMARSAPSLPGGGT